MQCPVPISGIALTAVAHNSNFSQRFSTLPAQHSSGAPALLLYADKLKQGTTLAQQFELKVESLSSA
jgi:hypothetical protein